MKVIITITIALLLFSLPKLTKAQSLNPKAQDSFTSTEIIFATGPFVGGIHEAENQKAAEELATRLFDKLSNTAKTIKND